MAKPGFNCGDQALPPWWERAELCANYLGRVSRLLGRPVDVADIGCGDQKLKIALSRLGVMGKYRGYDLLPQSDDVTRFDVREDELPSGGDAIVMLGVLEYIDNIDDVLSRAAQSAPYLLISHVVKNGGHYSEEQLKALGWVTHLSEFELGGKLGLYGFSFQEYKLIDENKTLVVLCKSERFNPAASLASTEVEI